MTTDFWVKFKKPWTEEQCRDRYIKGPKVGLRGLEQESGRSKAATEHWCRRDNWVEQRRQYQDRLQTATKEKTIQKTSDRVSDELSQISENHQALYKQMQRLSNVALSVVARRLGQAQSNQTIDAELGKISAKELLQWCAIADRGIKGERMVTGLDFVTDINAAFNRLTKEGYEIIDPSDSEAESEE